MAMNEAPWDQYGQYADDSDEDRAPSFPVEDTTVRLPVRESVSVEAMVAVIKGGR